MNQGGYLLLSIVAFFLTGIGLYAVDRKLTVAFRRFLHDWTSPESEPFPEKKAQGLIYGRKAKQRFFVAGTISLIQTVLSVYRLEFNPLLELVTLLIETPIMVLGTYLGDRMNRVFDRAQPVFDAIDRIEAGESTPGGEARELIEDISETIRGDSGGGKQTDNEEQIEAKRSVEGEVAPDQNRDTSATDASSTADPMEDPRALMRKYTGE